MTRPAVFANIDVSFRLIERPEEKGWWDDYPLRGWIVQANWRQDSSGNMIGLLITSAHTSSLQRVEIVVGREFGGDTLTGCLMTDNGGPDSLMETFSFAVPPAQSNPRLSVISAKSSVHSELKSGKRYWFLLAAPQTGSTTASSGIDTPTRCSPRLSGELGHRANSVFIALMAPWCKSSATGQEIPGRTQVGAEYTFVLC